MGVLSSVLVKSIMVRLLIVEGMVLKRLEGPAGEPLEPKNSDERVD